jgi:AcrR family transcriptional regulator
MRSPTPQPPAGEPYQPADAFPLNGRRKAKRLGSAFLGASFADSRRRKGNVSPVGLREEKKERVREQLLDVAMKLFTERGYEETTVDDIVNAAGVSRRTFFRYFETKDDVAIAWNLDDDFEGHDIQFAEALATQRPGDTPLAALRDFSFKALCLREKSPDLAKLVLKVEELIAKTPSLRARRLSQIARFAENVAAELAKRWNMDVERDLQPRLMANCAIAVVESANHLWAARGGRDSRAELMDQAFKTFEAQFAAAARSGMSLSAPAKRPAAPQKAKRSKR